MTDKVGYGKPPVHSRYQKGKSGNPRGRPKGSGGARSVLEKALRETVTVRQGDKSRKVPKREALIKKLLNDALQGDGKALSKIFDYIRATEERGAFENGDPDPLKVIIEFVNPDGTTRQLE